MKKIHINIEVKVEAETRKEAVKIVQRALKEAGILTAMDRIETTIYLSAAI